jgi:4-carboxymuconolactone decarboxylase
LKTARLPDTPGTEADAAHFTGRVLRHDLILGFDPVTSAQLVRFEAGARTDWHRHPAGQYLFVVAGSGFAQARDGDLLTLQSGDCVFAAPGEEHWHGAAAHEAMAQLAFSFGFTQWKDRPPLGCSQEVTGLEERPEGTSARGDSEEWRRQA